MPRRRFAPVAFVLAVTVAACTGSGAPSVAPDDRPFAGRTLRVATWGGDWGSNVEKSVGELFEAETGGNVEYVVGNPPDNLAKLISAPQDDPPFDVMQMDSLTQEGMIKDGLIESVDHAKLPVEDLFEEAVTTDEYGPAFTLVPVVIAWSPEKFAELGLDDPTTFDDLFAPELRGRVAYPGIRVGFAPLIISGLANAWFGDREAAEQAIEKIKEMEPRVYGATPEMATWLTNGEVYAAVTHTAQVQAMRNQGFELSLVYPEAGDKRSMVYWNMANIVRGTKNKDMAEEWLRLNLSCEGQEAFARTMGAVPTCKSANEAFASDEALKTIAVTDEDLSAMFQAEPSFILEVRESWNDAWNRIMGT